MRDFERTIEIKKKLNVLNKSKYQNLNAFTFYSQ